MQSTIRRPAPFHPVWQYHVQTVGTRKAGLFGTPVDHRIVEQHCNGLGAQGWELIGVAPVTNANGATRELRLFFKRLVPHG